MKSRPILFSAQMVRALLDGSKTQTRRLCKPMNFWVNQDCREVRTVNGKPFHFLKSATSPMEELRCPYGQPGDQLWVRETFYEEFGCAPKDTDERLDWLESGYLAYKASDEHPYGSGGRLSWKPSIFMPRWASRITLELTAVRAERLQDISEVDAIEEGIWKTISGYYSYGDEYNPNYTTARDAYRALWESINGPGSWEANPWVWVLEFKRA